MASEYDDGWDAGQRTLLRELTPLADAIRDAIFMFKDIAKARQLPSTGQAVNQYVAMGKQLERVLSLSKLKPTIEEADLEVDFEELRAKFNER